mgnify:CR=1 FL=1
MPKTNPSCREDFFHFQTIPTRWMDNDVYQHVNNVVYYSFFDTAVNQFLIEQGYYAPILISAGEAQPQKMKELGYEPKKIIPSDGFLRGYYDNIKNDDLVALTCLKPKSSRYVLMQKK